ncbi:rna-directed dna polymerase from mobile element jockey-like [Willisornis vidua]|uniref:Rna-directed dna polymerase from mobile element jockey-like n=1 Tax=Willisornis vidua TaxID=1566151 RepID=A0ABQ9DRD6_9PASS|nr:rna-directed dna polymerase from mobile element jockey-like [Willisornis vidua]
MLGPLLLHIFINNLEKQMDCILTKFTDNIKLRDADKGQSCLSDGPGEVEEWTNRDLMKFNMGQCKVLYYGQTNPLQQYGLGTSQLESGSDEQGLEVPADNGRNRTFKLMRRKKPVTGVTITVYG